VEAGKGWDKSSGDVPTLEDLWALITFIKCSFESATTLRGKVRRCYTASDCNDISNLAHTGCIGRAGERHIMLVPGKYAGWAAAPGDGVLAR